MNAIAPCIPDILISTDLALLCAGFRVKAIVRGLEIKGHPPKRFCGIEARDRRLFAILRFDGTTEELAIPLDLWLAQEAR